MKITIDTKHDSHVEIRKAIRLLSSLVGDSASYTNEPAPEPSVPNLFDDPSPAVGNMMSMFDGPETPEPEKPEPKPQMRFF